MYEQPIRAQAPSEVFVGRYIDLTGADWGLEASFANYIAAFDDGRALIAREKASAPEIRRVLSDIERRLNKELRRSYVDMNEIAEARRVGVAGRRGQADSGMQGRILSVIEEAHSLGASDIHIDVGAELTLLDYRIDGRLRRQHTWTADEGEAFLGAAYAMADIANGSYTAAKYLNARLAPRGGRDDWAFPEGIESVRMTFNPVAFGRAYAIFRLLDVIRDVQSVEQLGYEPEQLPLITEFGGKSKGLGLVVGVTGSGKSTTMCCALQSSQAIDQANGYRRALFTVEDPPERRIVGAQQLVVHNADTEEGRAKAWSDALRAAMRSDPDQLMIGEIRDPTTAKFAFSMTLTGHQVMSTLHCTSAHTVPFRLFDLGVDRSLVWDSEELYFVAAQTLMPLLCPHCKITAQAAIASGKLHESSMARFARAFGSHFFVEGDGCAECDHRGIKGRTVVAEVIRFDSPYLDVLKNQGISAARQFCSARGEPSIAEIAKRKVVAGLISPVDVERDVQLDQLADEPQVIERIAA